MIIFIIISILTIAFLGILGYGITYSIKNINALLKEKEERLARLQVKDLQIIA